MREKDGKATYGNKIKKGRREEIKCKKESMRIGKEYKL